MLYSPQPHVFLPPGSFISEGGGQEKCCGSPERGHDLLHLSQPAGPPQANIKQLEHLFADTFHVQALLR